MATHSSILAWEVSWREETGCYSPWGYKELDTTEHACKKKSVKFSSFQSLGRVWPFATRWTAACQTSLYITNSQSLLKLISIDSVMPSNHLMLCVPFLLPHSIFPSKRSFQMSQLFASDGQSIGVSASTSDFPMNIQDWSPLGWIGLITLQSKGLSRRVFSNTTVQKHHFYGTQLSLY